MSSDDDDDDEQNDDDGCSSRCEARIEVNSADIDNDKYYYIQ